MADVFDTIFGTTQKVAAPDEFDDIFGGDEFDDIFTAISPDEPVMDPRELFTGIPEIPLSLPTAGADPTSIGPTPGVVPEPVDLLQAAVGTMSAIVEGTKTFGQAFVQSLASKPALALKGVTPFTPGEAFGVDKILNKTSEFLNSLRNPNTKKEIEQKMQGKLFPVHEGASWTDIDSSLLPEVINTWAANVGDQIPLILMTFTGRMIGRVTGKPAGAGAGLLAGLVTAGPDPTDVVTVPAVATATARIVEHLSGAAPLVAIEAGGFLEQAESIGIDKDISEKYARIYGVGSGAVEYAQVLWNLKAFKRLSVPARKTIMRRVLTELAGNAFEGVEEFSQQGLENFFLGKAIDEMKTRNPSFIARKPEIFEGGGRAFAIGTGVSIVTRGFGRSSVAVRDTLAGDAQKEVEAAAEDLVAINEKTQPATIEEPPPEPTPEPPAVAPVAEVPVEPPVTPPKAAQRPTVAEQRRTEVERRLRAGEEVSPRLREEFADLVAEIEKPVVEAEPAVKTVAAEATVPGTKIQFDEVKAPITGQGGENVVQFFKEGEQVHQIRTRNATEQKEQVVGFRELLAKPAKIIVPVQIQKGKPFKPVSKKGPGLTQSEQEILTTEQQQEFRFKQTQGEKAGFKAGMQEVVAENRKKIKSFQLATKLSDQNRTDALEVVKQFVPKEKQAVFTKRILAAKTPQRVDRITKAVQLFIDKAEKRAAARDFKAFLNKTNKEFRRGEVKLGKLPTDIREKVIAIVDKFDPSKITEKKRKQLEKRDEFIKRVSGTVADAFESLEDVGADILQIPNARIDELQRLSKIHIGTLSTEQVNYINASLGHLIQTARKRGESKERARSERVAKQVNAARQEVSKRTKEEGIIKQPTGVGGMFRTVFVQGQSSIRTMAGRATIKNNEATMDLLVESIQDAKRAEHVIIKQFSEAAEKAISKDLGFANKDSAEFDKLISITLGGKRFRIDIDNLFSIYMAIKADGNLRQLLNSEGLNITVVERDPKLLNVIKTKKQILTGRVQLSEVREVVKIIEAIPKFKELSETTFKLNKDVVSPEVNKTSIAFQNFPIARKEKYWPQPRSLTKNIEGKATDVSVAIEQQGMFLPKKGGTARLMIRPYRSQFVNILQTSAQFSASTLPMRDAKSLLGNKQWQDNMRKAGRSAELKGLIMMFRRMQGLSTDKAFVDLAGAKLLNNFGKSVLSLRLSGYGVQTASIPAAYEFIDPKHFKTTEIIRKAARIPAKDIQEMIDLSPTLWIRWKAKQFNYVTGGVAAQHSFNNMILGKTPLLDKFLNQYTWGDQKAIKIIFDAAQNKVASEQNLKKGTAENKKAAIKETEKALETQPNWDIIYRSPLTSSPNVFLRGSLMFQSARNAQMNVLMRAVDDFNKGRTNATEAGKRMGGVLYANTLVAIVKRLLKLGIKASIIGLVLIVRDEEEDAVGVIAREGLKEVKRLPQDTVLNLIGLPAFGNIPSNIAREVIRSFKRPASSFRKITDVRTGNFFTDLILDATGIGISAGSLGKHLLTQEKISRGPREGRPKWRDDAENMALGIAELIAIRYGLPLAAPRQEIFFQTKAALRAIEKEEPEKKRGGF